MEMTMIEALEKLAELNDYAKILVQNHVGEPQLIKDAIDDEQRAGDPDEILDLRVTKDSIRGYYDNGHPDDNNEPLYKVRRDITMFDDLSKE